MARLGEHGLPSAPTTRERLTAALRHEAPASPTAVGGEYSTPCAGGRRRTVQAPSARLRDQPGTPSACDAEEKRVAKYVKPFRGHQTARRWSMDDDEPEPDAQRRGRRQGPQRRDPRPLPHLRLRETVPPGTIRPHHLPLRRRTRPRAQPAPAQELSARRDHRARPRARRAGRGLRRQLLRRPGVGGLQTREPAAAQQGPPQDPLRRQDARCRWPRPPRSTAARATGARRRDAVERRRRGASTTTSPAGSCAPRSTRPSR